MCAALVLAAALLVAAAVFQAIYLIPVLCAGAVVFVYAIARNLRRTGRDQKLKLRLISALQKRGMWRTGKTGPLLLGRLDGVLDGEAYGWAVDIRQSAPPKLTIYVDGDRAADLLPVQYRPDVGAHAFYFDLHQYGTKSESRIEARFPDGRLVANSPITARIPVRSSEPDARAVLFMHIAKTAGTAFREAIAENYRQSEIAYLYPDPPGLLVENLGVLPIEQRRGFRVVIGHFQYGAHAALPQAWTYVTIVREPVARVISHYRYDWEPPGDGGAKRGAAGLIEAMERRASVNLDNLMVRCFAGVDEREFPPGSIDKGVYDLAVHHLKTAFSFVGHQERSNEAYSALQQQFHWKPNLLPDVNRNRASAAGDYQDARSAIEQYNQWDCRLYAEICRIFP